MDRDLAETQRTKNAAVEGQGASAGRQRCRQGQQTCRRRQPPPGMPSWGRLSVGAGRPLGRKRDRGGGRTTRFRAPGGRRQRLLPTQLPVRVVCFIMTRSFSIWRCRRRPPRGAGGARLPSSASPPSQIGLRCSTPSRCGPTARPTEGAVDRSGGTVWGVEGPMPRLLRASRWDPKNCSWHVWAKKEHPRHASGSQSVWRGASAVLASVLPRQLSTSHNVGPTGRRGRPVASPNRSLTG